MSGRLDYAAAKKRRRIARQTAATDYAKVSLRGWRLTDGKEYPVTVTRREVAKAA